jgi:hypothetical protein
MDSEAVNSFSKQTWRTKKKKTSKMDTTYSKRFRYTTTPKQKVLALKVDVTSIFYFYSQIIACHFENRWRISRIFSFDSAKNRAFFSVYEVDIKSFKAERSTETLVMQFYALAKVVMIF